MASLGPQFEWGCSCESRGLCERLCSAEGSAMELWGRAAHPLNILVLSPRTAHPPPIQVNVAGGSVCNKGVSAAGGHTDCHSRARVPARVPGAPKPVLSLPHSCNHRSCAPAGGGNTRKQVIQRWSSGGAQVSWGDLGMQGVVSGLPGLGSHRRTRRPPNTPCQARDVLNT